MIKKKNFIYSFIIIALSSVIISGCAHKSNNAETYDVSIETFKTLPGVQRVQGSTEEDYYVICDDVNTLMEYCNLGLPEDGEFKLVDILVEIDDKTKIGHVSMDVMDDSDIVFAHINGAFALTGNDGKKSIEYGYTKDSKSMRETKDGIQVQFVKIEEGTNSSLTAYYEIKGIHYKLITEPSPGAEDKVMEIVEWESN